MKIKGLVLKVFVAVILFEGVCCANINADRLEPYMEYIKNDDGNLWHHKFLDKNEIEMKCFDAQKEEIISKLNRIKETDFSDWKQVLSMLGCCFKRKLKMMVEFAGFKQDRADVRSYLGEVKFIFSRLGVSSCCSVEDYFFKKFLLDQLICMKEKQKEVFEVINVRIKELRLKAKEFFSCRMITQEEVMCCELEFLRSMADLYLKLAEEVNLCLQNIEREFASVKEKFELTKKFDDRFMLNNVSFEDAFEKSLDFLGKTNKMLNAEQAYLRLKYVHLCEFLKPH